MEAQLWQRRRRLALAGAALVGGYYAYPHAKKFLKGVIAFVEAFAAAGDLANTLVTDLKGYVDSENSTEQVPESVQQLLRILQCAEAQRLTRSTVSAVVAGAMESGGTQSTMDFEQILKHALDPRAETLVSTLVGGAMRESLRAYYEVAAEQAQQAGVKPEDQPLSRAALQAVELACSAPVRRVIRETTAVCVATAVGVYTDKTKDLNFTDQALSSIAKPAHRAAVSEVAAHVVGDAVRASVHACHEVLTTPQRARLPPDGEQPSPSYLTHHAAPTPSPPGGPSTSSTPCSLKVLRRRLALSQGAGAASPLPPLTPSTVAKASPPTWNRCYGPSTSSIDSALPQPSARGGAGRAAQPSGTMRDLIQVMGAPEVRKLACEVVGSAVWGGVRASADCAKDLAASCMPQSLRRGGNLPAPVFLAVILSLSIHINNLGLV